MIFNEWGKINEKRKAQAQAQAQANFSIIQLNNKKKKAKDKIEFVERTIEILKANECG